ncbi:MAG: protein-L-isoaspartate(D-aspartate) O-methyltransferase [Gammaproteobacteria bacterium]|uniref:Protein-L-isoaspartate O-methyltransferase n=1 Tax=SAR86 cluster bacterium TaxID=2030880 RepID=A0A520MV04_9GAMM|nr:protein-L-isoaspartate(D-aspartate) O-methyltransferase [Gammaproteobacteria bacterium]MDC0942416.1 protein-L-isoaspartate(D-aspartate) O-methyltransferase [Gammaproteobacteria bacterium]MDC1131486.1 protein-L-isoaspartate(D-aspartate) O-methyltransferase [Gammaproteobacteria bacterium]MDC1146862.1 protein-L-isoaspartate(D-aspartate) O-methyltransferase [Gammaproteobacteria bacterium]RZO25048.1 MAG: protein-L-isoaspartate(D-aspartate) O-methyltransferase [SAR86 cluster bacterium]
MSSSGFTFTRVKDQMIQQLLDMGISDFRVLDALSQVPRHIFLDQALWSRAYENRALTIGYKQTISQPYIVARMTEHLIAHTSKRGKVLNKVLEIGSGCGYQSAVLSYFASDVFAVERIKPLVSKSRENLSDLKIRNVIVKHADGFNGWEEDLKFDGIICAAAPRQYPEELLELLEIGGKLVIPVGLEGEQKLYVVTKKSDTENEEMIYEEVAFVPMLPGVSNGEV